jgi:putative inorganic carbon (hco3(-)) transporter
VSTAFLALAGLILAAVPVFLRHPARAVFVFAFLLLLHANLVLSSEFRVGLADPMLFGTMLGLVATYPLLHGDRPGGSGRFLAAFGLWLAAVLNSFAWSTSLGVTPMALRDFLPNVLYAGVLFLMVTDRPRVMAALSGLAAASVLLSVLTILKVSLGLEGFDFYGLARGSVDHIAIGAQAIRPSGPVEDPNYYSQILLPGFGIVLGAFLSAPTAWRRNAGFVATILIGGAILLTASRGGMLAMFVTMVVLLVIHRKLRYLALLIMPVAALLYFVPSYYDRLVSLTTSTIAVASGEGETESSVSGRLAEMAAAAYLFAEHPLAGIGFGMFESRYQDISANQDMVLRGSDRSAHSLYLETAAEQGLVGLAALLFLLGSSLRAVQLAHRRAARSGDAVLANALLALGAGALGVFVSSLFLHDAYAQHFWLVLALLFAAERAAGVKSIALQR